MIMMTIAQIMEKMIAFSEGNIHDITHLKAAVGVAVFLAAERTGNVVGDRRHFQNKLGLRVQPFQFTDGLGIGPHAAIRSRRVTRWCGSFWQIPA